MVKSYAVLEIWLKNGRQSIEDDSRPQLMTRSGDQKSGVCANRRLAVTMQFAEKIRISTGSWRDILTEKLNIGFQ